MIRCLKMHYHTVYWFPNRKQFPSEVMKDLWSDKDLCKYYHKSHEIIHSFFLNRLASHHSRCYKYICITKAPIHKGADEEIPWMEMHREQTVGVSSAVNDMVTGFRAWNSEHDSVGVSVVFTIQKRGLLDPVSAGLCPEYGWYRVIWSLRPGREILPGFSLFPEISDKSNTCMLCKAFMEDQKSWITER